MIFLLTRFAHYLRVILRQMHYRYCSEVTISRLVAVVLVLLVTGCGPAMDEDGYILLSGADEPELMPYQLNEVAGTRYALFPIDLGEGTERSLYQLKNNWHPPDTLSAVLFQRFGGSGAYTLDQANRKTLAFLTTLARDYDLDGVEEVAVSYRRGDSCFVDLIDPFTDTLYSCLLVVGEDSDGSGNWDGDVFIQDAIDVTGDGYPEILCNVTAGYDLAPRRLYCIDWINDTIVWTSDHPGFLGFTGCHPIITGDGSDTLLVHASNSPCNGAVVDSRDDCHSYVYALDTRGHVRWVYATGPQYSDTHPQLKIDHGTGEIRIFTQRYYVHEDDSLLSSRVMVLDGSGRVLDSVDVDGVVQTIASHQDSATGMIRLAVRVDDTKLWIFDGQLDLLGKVRGEGDLVPMEWYDVLGIGYPQLEVRLAGNRAMLLGDNFQPLAVAPHFISVSYLNEPIKDGILIGRAPGHSMILAPRKTPVLTLWYTRYRTHLFVLVAVLLGGMLTAVYFQRRTRSNLIQIAAQKTQIENAHSQLTAKNVELNQAYADLEQTHHKLKETQDKLVQAEKYQQARDIAGAFAHEIRNALFPARYALNAMRRLQQGPTPIERTLPDKIRQLNRSVTRAIDLTKVISDYTRLDADFKPEPVAVQEIVDSCRGDYESIFRDSGIRFVASGDNEAVVQVGRVHLRMALCNLIQNAIDAVDGCEQPEIDLAYRNSNGTVSLAVKDNGCGIPEENLQRVFDAFYTTKPMSGTGLGLATVRRVASMYDGSVEVQSQEGRGTTVTLNLPAGCLH